MRVGCIVSTALLPKYPVGFLPNTRSVPDTEVERSSKWQSLPTFSLALRTTKPGGWRKQSSATCGCSRLIPNRPKALQLLGLIVFQKGQPEQALQLIRRAIELNGTRSDFYNNLGNILTQLGRLDEAAAAYRRSLELKPDDASTRSNLLVRLNTTPTLRWPSLAAAHGEFERWHAAPLLAERKPLTIDRNPERRLTVGFISPNFRQHPVGHFVLPILENLDRDQFHVVCYSDGTTRDEWTERFQAASTIWRETSALSNVQLAEQIRADRIDILFDLAGHTALNRLLVFARKPAPIQITWGDYVGTTGLAAMDFILADRYEIPPEAETYYAERVLRMPHGYVCYEPPAYAPAVSALAGPRTGIRHLQQLQLLAQDHRQE